MKLDKIERNFNKLQFISDETLQTKLLVYIFDNFELQF